jgi:hypothetical protein
MPRMTQVDPDRIIAHIRAHQPCSFISVHRGVLGWECAGNKPNKGLMVALHALEKAGTIKVTPFKHGPHTRRLYEVRT